MQLIGLTGGTGSGKSEAGRRFATRDMAVIDADAVGHDVIAPGGAAADAGARRFRRCHPDPTAPIHREKLGARVFGDAEALSAH